MTHYETLGVATDATSDAIKRAWRRASSAAHPDKEGGSTERQQAVNKAYEVLSDPGRRAQYDATGDDRARKPIEEEAHSRLMALFSKAVSEDVDDILNAVRHVLRHQLDEQGVQIIAGQQEIARLKRHLKKVRRKDGQPSQVDALIDARIASVNDTLARMQHAKSVMKEAIRLADEFETDPPPVITPTMTSGSYFTLFGAMR